MALSSRLAVSGQISIIIRPDIRYFPAGYPVFSSRISSIIWSDIRYYLAGYPVRQLAGYPNPAVKNCRISGIRFCFNQQDIWYPVFWQNHYPVHPYLFYIYLINFILLVFFYYAKKSVACHIATLTLECSTWHKFPNPGGAISTKKCPISNPGGTILTKYPIYNPGGRILIKYVLCTTQGAQF